MRIAVCDDCPEDALSLKSKLTMHEVTVYSGASDLLTDIEGGKQLYDLYLLDIYMDKSMNGLELAEKLRNIHEEAVICFVSTSDDFYREAYDLYAIQYLIKPVAKEQLEKLLAKVQKMLARGNEQKLVYSWRGKSGAILYSKIRYIGSRGHTLYICCTDGSTQESTGKLNDLEHQICGEVFMRCHQSFIVNMYHVESLSGTDLILGGEKIPISRRYYDKVKGRYREILFEVVE